MDVDPSLHKYVVYIPKTHYQDIVQIPSNARLADIWDYLCVKKIEGSRFLKADLPKHPLETLKIRCKEWVRNACRSDGTCPSQYFGFDLFSDIFPMGPSGNIDIIIADKVLFDELESEREAAQAPSHFKLLEARKAALESLKAAPSPSDFVNDIASMCRTLSSDNTPLHIGQPWSNHGLPVALYSPILAELQYNLEHLDQLPTNHEDITAAFNYNIASLDFYNNETERDNAMRRWLCLSLGADPLVRKQLENSNVTPDVRWVTRDVSYIIEEKENEAKFGDPLLQAMMSYGKCVTQPKCATFLADSNMPALLLGTSSTRLEVASAIFTDGVYANKLISVDLHTSVHAALTIQTLSKVFTALRTCRYKLQEYYETLAATKSTPGHCLAHLFPQPTALPQQPFDSQPVASHQPAIFHPAVDLLPTAMHPPSIPRLVFVTQLSRLDGAPISQPDSLNRSHGLFLAKIDQANTDTVKFVIQYNEHAHRLLANAGLAPKLRACIPVCGNMHMVIMERILGQNMDGNGLPDYALSAISKAMHILHSNNIVFGDMRKNNIVVLEKERRAFLVDFDRCAENDVGIYPCLVNEELYGAYSGIKRGAKMKIEHDQEQMYQLDIPVKQT